MMQIRSGFLFHAGIDVAAFIFSQYILWRRFPLKLDAELMVTAYEDSEHSIAYNIFLVPLGLI